MGVKFRFAWFSQAVILLLAWPLAAQVRFGEVSTNMNGNISTGYTADFGNMTSSDHGWTVGGETSLSGSFHSPNFLSFNANLYLNQSRSNSNFQSISNASGVDFGANIFAGSEFPGAVNYSLAYNAEGNYAVPGLANYVTHGNNNTFGISWGENIPNKPTLSASFQLGDSQYSVYGSNDEGKNSFHSFNLHSGYSLDGFNMGAYYSTGGAHSLLPEIVASQEGAETHSADTNYGFNVSHMIPLKGSFSAGINRSSWDSSYMGSSSTGSIDMVNADVAIHPFQKFSLSASMNYSDNLSGQLIQAIVAAGGAVPALNTSEASDSMSLMAVAAYNPALNVQTTAYVERRTQSFEGEDYGVNSLGGSVAYQHKLMNGYFNASLNVTENTSDNTGEDTLGFATAENYSTIVKGWHVSGSFGYSQNVQTLLVTYMNSSYNYSGNLRRRWGRFNLSAGAGGSSTALTQQAGTANTSQSYNASAGFGTWVSANGSYTKASGQALATGAGLVPVPIPLPILPSSLVSLYGGDSYSLGFSSTPVSKLVLTASFAKSLSNTSSSGITSSNENSQYNALIQYQVRKMYFNSGYSRLQQGFSITGTQPEIISSYYIGVSRWFNFF